jgi:hypothetical protein
MSPETNEKALVAPAVEEMALFGAEEAITGFEGASGSSFAIPFLLLLQKGSPQCDPDKGNFNPNAKPGMWLDSSTGELIPVEGFQFIPCHFTQTIVEWVPRDIGGGFIAAHSPEHGLTLATGKNEKGIPTTKDGNELRDTRTHFGLRVREDSGLEPVVLSFTSSAIKVSRNWMASMRKKTVMGKNGPVRAVTYAYIYKVSSESKSNKQYTWKIPQVTLEGPIKDAAMWEKAKEAVAMFVANAGMAIPPAEEGNTDFPTGD